MTAAETKMNGLSQRESHRQGFTLIEVILVIILMALTVVPLLEAFRPSLISLNQAERTTVFKHQAMWTLSRVAAMDYQDLESNSSDNVNLDELLGSSDEADKESFTFKGQRYNSPEEIVVKIKQSDKDEDDIGGLLEIGVCVEEVCLKTLKAED